MDIAVLSMSLAHSELSNQVSVAVFNLVKNESDTLGQSMIQDMKQMEQSVYPNLGNQIDISV